MAKAPESTQPAPQKKSLLTHWGPLVVSVAVLVLLMGAVFTAVVLLDPHQWVLKRARYEKIVQKIEAIGVPAGEEREFLVSKDKDPASLQPAPNLRDLPHWDLYDKLVSGQVVSARRTKEGRLVVRIMMASRRPTYTLVYFSDEPSQTDLSHAFGMGQGHKVGEWWWAIEDRSD